MAPTAMTVRDPADTVRAISFTWPVLGLFLLLTCGARAADELLSTAPVPDGCGLAPGPRSGTFLVSSGRGGVMTIDARTGKNRRIASVFLEHSRWDNHMMVAKS